MAEPPGRLHILVEGQTEETLVREVFEPHLSAGGWWVTFSVVTTKRPAGGTFHRGGISGWSQLERDVRILLKNSGLAVLTTIIDYYGLPPTTPGMPDRPARSAIERVRHVENAIRDHFGDHRLIPHLTLHETEAWVYAARNQLGDLLGYPSLTRQMQQDIDSTGGPELINDDPNTAPSKRLQRYCPGYQKTIDGPLAIVDLGLDRLRSQCPHLDAWLRELRC